MSESGPYRNSPGGQWCNAKSSFAPMSAISGQRVRGSKRYGMLPEPDSFGLDIRFTNDAAIFVILIAKIGAELRAARCDGRESLNDQLRFDLGRLRRSAEPTGELGDGLLRCLFRRERPEPRIYLVVRVARLSYSGRVRQQIDPRPRGDGEHAQLACLYVLRH